MKLGRRITAILVCCSLVLAGCVTPQGGSGGSGVSVGPQLSSIFNKATRLGKEQKDPRDPSRPKLDVIIPVFDPGLPEDEEDYDAEGLWPELRRAESVRFAYKMKLALEETGAFGAVRVTPDKTATGDLYLMGKIEESNGEDVEFSMEVVDISGNRWLFDSFDHEVDMSFHKNVRNKGKDPYDPLFEKAAQELVEELSYQEQETLVEIKRLTDLRFAASFVEEAFAEYMETKGNRIRLVGFPSDNDPMLLRTKAVRVRDQLFVDGMQDHYRTFSAKMDESYRVWQEQSLIEIEAQSEARKKATGEAIAGVALIGLAILAIAAGADSDNVGTSSAAATAGTIGAIGGATLLSESFQTSKSTKIHADAIDELGESIDADLASHVIDFEEKTVELTGSAAEQFGQWREFLKKIYMEEQTPEVQL